MGWISIALEPTALVAWGILVAAIVLWKNYKSVIQLISVVSVLAVYLIIATPLGANILVDIIETRKNQVNCNIENQEAIIVLAGGIYGDPDSEDEVWRLKEDSYRRALLGIKLAKEHPKTKIIFSGGYGGAIREADLMKYLAIQNGINKKRIYLDRKSKNTYESAESVSEIIKENKVTTSVLVTSAIHMRRSIAAFKKAGISPCPYPVNSRYVETYFPEALLPQISALTKSTESMHEVMGYVWYWVKGKI